MSGGGRSYGGGGRGGGGGAMGGRGGGRTAGTIESDKIRAAHQQVRAIAEAYKKVNIESDAITAMVRENWVGEGRNEFESQYNLLIRKIEDFGDTLQDIYGALVQAEADYQEADNSLKQTYKMAVESAQGNG